MFKTNKPDSLVEGFEGGLDDEGVGWKLQRSL